MSFRNAILVTAGLLGVGLSLVGTGITHALTGNDAGIAGTGQPPASAHAPTLYGEALAAATTLRGGPASAAVGRPVSLAFMTSLLRAASFGAQRPAPAQWSLFLPVDAAFDRLGGRQLDALIHDPETRRALIDRHLLAEPVSLADLKQGEPVTTLGGQALAVSVGDKPRLNGATVLAERTIGDGRVFIVDHLL